MYTLAINPSIPSAVYAGMSGTGGGVSFGSRRIDGEGAGDQVLSRVFDRGESVLLFPSGQPGFRSIALRPQNLA